jgi:hypothetical protein
VLTGDFVTHQLLPKKFSIGPAWQCANILNGLQCARRYAVLGNHDALVGVEEITRPLVDNGITVLKNESQPIELAGARFWIAGLGDVLEGDADPEVAIPASLRNSPNEPIILLCHEPDYADELLAFPSGKAVALMLSGHSHGGQVRLPLIGALTLPNMGRKYIQGWFRLGKMQLHVNRGLGTVGVPFRFDCPPEISLLTLRSA